MSTKHLVTRSEGFLFVGGLAVAETIIGQLGATSATAYASGGNGGVTTGVLLALMLFTAGVAALWTNQMAAKWGGQKVFASAYIGVAMSPDIPAGELFVNPNQDTEFDSEFAV